jgi:hypothetical protein
MSNPSRLTRAGTVLSVLMVGGVAAVISFVHLQELAARSGEGWRSALLPLAVDGMLLGATLAIVDARRRRQPVGWVPWLGLIAGILASLAGNVAAAQPDLIARLVAAWAPAALAISIETLVIVLRRTDAPAESHTADAQLHADGLAPGAGSPGAGSGGIDTDSGSGSRAARVIPQARPGARTRGVNSRTRSRKLSPQDPELIASVARMLAADRTLGRPRIARELGITPYAARVAMEHARELLSTTNGNSNGHVSTPEPGQGA